MALFLYLFCVFSYFVEYRIFLGQGGLVRFSYSKKIVETLNKIYL